MPSCRERIPLILVNSISSRNPLIPVNIAVEDDLSEVVLRKLLFSSEQTYTIGTCYCQGGYGYLKRLVGGINRAVKGTPFIVLTDLDKANCPLALIEEWVHGVRNKNLILRVAVREVESWLLADRYSIAKYLGLNMSLIPLNPENLEDPKATLISLAKKSHYNQIRKDIVPQNGSTSKQGRNYNGRLSQFVKAVWSPNDASKSSNSLKKMINILENFQPTWL
jgi:hypothetical protein